jgi:hypothetical protein
MRSYARTTHVYLCASRQPLTGVSSPLFCVCGVLAVGYGPYFGKKVDPEPGRCRRTDGKKWRCAKEAAPDSKYCERHMHRGRNRSRKPVEAQLAAPTHAQQQPPAAAAGFQNQSLYPAGLAGNGGRGGGGGGLSTGTFGLGSTAQLHMDSTAAYATATGGGSKDLRCVSATSVTCSKLFSFWLPDWCQTDHGCTG